MQDCKEHDIWTVTTTVGSLADARALGLAVVEARLAACAQLEAVTASIYRWQGKTCEEPEVRVTLKTLPHCVEPLQALIADRHPYELPQFTAWAVAASPAYAQWVRGEVVPRS